ncbi:MAG: hypothetical protein QW478_11245, partial [Candidatus Micrarchaeaceae archaeon]
MFKTNNKKMLTVIVAVAMIFSAFAILSFTAQPAYAASGSITLDPTVFAKGTATITLANGGTFGSGATVYFYLSNTTAFSSPTLVGNFTLPAGTTTLSNAVVKLKIPSTISAGTYYIAASDSVPSSSATAATYTSPVQVTVSKLSPSIKLTPSSAPAGTSVILTGSNFDSGSNVTVYLNYASGPVLITSVSYSALKSGVPLTVPTNEPNGTYNIVAQESSPTSQNYGITADSSLTIAPAVTVSPLSISGATTSTFTLNGYGFPADDSFAASTALNPKPTISFDSVDALNPAFTSSSSGSFTVTVTGLSAAVTKYGPASISLEDTSEKSYPGVGSIIVSVPNPSALGFNFSVTPTKTGIYNVNDSVAITVYNFPASQNIQFYLGTFLVGSLTSDSNGAGVLNTVVPPVPGGTYTPTAVVSSYYLITEPTSGTTSYTISPYFEAVDPSGTPLTSSLGEYVPSNGLITIKAYGLNPSLNTYDAYDSLVAKSPTGVYASGLVTSISVGTGTSALMQPASNGTLIFTYSPGYSSVAPSTGTEANITFSSSVSSVSGYEENNYVYYAIGSVTFTEPSALSIIASGAPEISLSVSGLIPYNAILYPGVVNSYNAYIGSMELTLQFTNQAGNVVTGTVFNSEDSNITFSVPSVTGLFNLSITYNGQSVSSAPGVEQIVISSSGSSPSSGSLVLVPTLTGYDIVGFGYDQAVSPVKLYYMSYGQPLSKGVNENLTDGAFVDELTLSSLPIEPEGTYALFTVATTSSGANYYVYSSYAVMPSLNLS